MKIEDILLLTHYIWPYNYVISGSSKKLLMSACVISGQANYDDSYRKIGISITGDAQYGAISYADYFDFVCKNDVKWISSGSLYPIEKKQKISRPPRFDEFKLLQIQFVQPQRYEHTFVLRGAGAQNSENWGCRVFSDKNHVIISQRSPAIEKLKFG